MAAGVDEADDVNKPGKAEVHEAKETKADEADVPMNGQNEAEANEADVAIMFAEADEADEPTSRQKQGQG